MTANLNSRWLFRPRPVRTPALRWFMLPHAGASAVVFRSWADHLPADHDLCAVQLPGRSERLAEPPFEQLTPLVEQLADELYPWLDVPFVIYGHSFGALVGFELTRTLRRRGLRAPMRLVVSGRRAPSVPSARALHLLPNEALEQRVRDFGGTPDEILMDPELRSLFLGLIRADFKVIETYQYSEEAPLDVSMSMLCGSEDREASEELMRPWLRESRAPSTFHVLSGGHFFVLERPLAVLRLLLGEIAETSATETREGDAPTATVASQETR
ncbi:MAG TPA: alpha/beta fold hydrolase [Polyangiaceae bacterium]|nr:alpha/beta fold hydrolase [Polyangiaceae bacterium]